MPNYFFSMETPRSPMLLQPFGEHLDQTRELRNTDHAAYGGASVFLARFIAVVRRPQSYVSISN
jgi:membrane protein DedA with SNARE-associated domain